MGILLHTMATPELDPPAAFELAARLGFDGIELILQTGYQCGLPETASERDAHLLGVTAADRGVPVEVLSSYEKRFASNDAVTQAQGLDGLRHAIDLASAMGAAGLRVLAGEAVADRDWASALGRLTAALERVSDHARAHGVVLLIENHMDTMATTAVRTAEICRTVNRDNVGILFDPANLATLGAEDFHEALRLQAGFIRHVHVKDAVTGKDGRRQSVVPGEGQDPWPELLHVLQRGGYAGHYSLEYERRWLPDLPAAEVALPRAKSFIECCLAGKNSGRAC